MRLDWHRRLEEATPWAEARPPARLARALFAAAAVLLLGSALLPRPLAEGDAGEYLLTTESLFRHLTPDLRPGDVTSVARLDRRLGLGLNYGAGFLGYFDDAAGRWYCYHFWAYPLLGLPARLLLAPLNGLRALPLTNAALLLLALHRVLFRAPFRAGVRLALFLLLLASPLLWFVRWPHAEVLIASCATLSLVGSYRGLRRAPILWAALATLQAPPFVLLLCFVAARRLAQEPSLRTLAGVALAAAPVLLSPVFFYWHFGTPSLIARESTHLSNLSAARALELLLDLDLGLLPYLPVLVGLFLAAVAAVAWRARRQPWDLGLLAVLVLMGVLTTLNGNWNSGTIGPSRYAIWLLPVAAFLVARMADGAPPRAWPALRAALAAAVVVQAAVVLAKGGPVADSDYQRHSYAARLVLRHAPAWYNPSFPIFQGRATAGAGGTEGPFVYADAGGCRKALARPRPRHERELRRLCGGLPAGAEEWFGRAPADQWRYLDY
jgi:hypothetical protein